MNSCLEASNVQQKHFPSSQLWLHLFVSIFLFTEDVEGEINKTKRTGCTDPEPQETRPTKLKSRETEEERRHIWSPGFGPINQPVKIFDLGSVGSEFEEDVDTYKQMDQFLFRQIMPGFVSLTWTNPFISFWWANTQCTNHWARALI